ncbi:chalcone isomerase [Fimicolochytrium jonesii]|uniref:chalcone isomerase n=1 Tax=Fimicolochytrium jonesii TaxID=1396493 RepID=UPI0022FDB58B|nr:chalcone isomerase [Fimicolochytrium jonesii]KAI8821020.1 chalcone isomerase [Fimicolochytrium jonesii]
MRLGDEIRKLIPVDSSEEPVTKKPIPTTLTLTLGATPQHFTLLGLGVRQVTFLNVSVYTIGYYISTPSIARLRSSPSFKSYTPATLSDFTAPLTRDTSTPLALRISPVRNTDGPHLRNGFMRILTRQLAAEDAMLTPEEKKGVLEAMDELRAAFPAGKVAKGEVFVFVKTEGGELRMVHEGVEKTVVRNRWVAERFFEGYLLDGKKVISEKLRKSIAEGLEHIIKA